MPIDDEKLKQYINERSVPNKLINDLAEAPLVNEDDIVFKLGGVNPRALTERRIKQELTEKEKNILFMLSHGLMQAEIAKVLDRSPNTLARHLTSARFVLRARNRYHAIGLALRAGLID